MSLPQTRVATRAYKLLATLAKAYQLPKKTAARSAAEAAAASSRALSPEFEALVAYVHKELTPSLNHALKDLGMVSLTLSLDIGGHVLCSAQSEDQMHVWAADVDAAGVQAAAKPIASHTACGTLVAHVQVGVRVWRVRPAHHP